MKLKYTIIIFFFPVMLLGTSTIILHYFFKLLLFNLKVFLFWLLVAIICFSWVFVTLICGLVNGFKKQTLIQLVISLSAMLITLLSIFGLFQKFKRIFTISTLERYSFTPEYFKAKNDLLEIKHNFQFIASRVNKKNF